MADKLLVEIDLRNSSADDAIRALLFLANSLVESPTVEIAEPIYWNERQSENYQVKWRFSEDEIHVPFNTDFAWQLNNELKTLKKTISKNRHDAIGSLQDRLAHCLAENRIELFEDADY